MELIEQNWMMLMVVTAASFLVLWIGGYRRQLFAWVVGGMMLTLALSVIAVERQWLDLTTATLAYGVLVIYCPIIGMIMRYSHHKSDSVLH